MQIRKRKKKRKDITTRTRRRPSANVQLGNTSVVTLVLLNGTCRCVHTLFLLVFWSYYTEI